MVSQTAASESVGPAATNVVRRSEAQLALVLGSIADGLLFLDQSFRVTYLNSRAEELLELAAGDALGREVWEILSESARSEFSISLALALRDHRTVTVRSFFEHVDAWIDMIASPNTEGLSIYLHDATDSEIARQELERRAAELGMQAAMLDQANDAMIVLDIDGTVRYWNSGASRIYGWTAAEMVGKLARTMLFTNPTEFDRILQALLRDAEWAGELLQTNRSGSDRLIDSRWMLIRDDHGRPQAIFSVGTDITERRKREERALRAQRLESLGTLTAGITHDLNNVLTPILMAVQLLSPGETDPRRKEILQSTEMAVNRGSEMIRNVLAFAGGATVHGVPMNIADVFGEFKRIWGDRLAPNVSISFEIDPDLWGVSGDPTQLLRVLLNLATNARDALVQGGAIAIRARNTSVTMPYSSISHVAPAGDYVSIEVEDSGSGIPPEVLDRIFEPFFTTKPGGAGTGLGLSTTLGIIRAHGGFMEAESEAGRGSVFRIHLPATVHTSEPSDAEHQHDELPAGNGELILVVEDDNAIRLLARQTLEAYGYTTAVARNGREAVDGFESDDARAALVFTDMMMPVMDGAATAKYFLQHHPEVPVVATSGLSENLSVLADPTSGIQAFLAKPYTTAELLSAIHRALHPEEADGGN